MSYSYDREIPWNLIKTQSGSTIVPIWSPINVFNRSKRGQSQANFERDSSWALSVLQTNSGVLLDSFKRAEFFSKHVLKNNVYPAHRDRWWANANEIDTQTSQQAAESGYERESKPKKPRQIRSKVKVMLLVFFSCRCDFFFSQDLYCHFESIESIKEDPLKELQATSSNALKKCSDDWIIRCHILKATK